MYVAVKGGEQAIEAAHRLLAEARRGDPAVPELTLEQIQQQLGLAVDRVMGEGSLYDRELAALALKQAAGDLRRGRSSCSARTGPRCRASGRAGRSTPRAMTRAPADLGHLQGPAGRADPRPHVRLHAPAARLRPGRRAGAVDHRAEPPPSAPPADAVERGPLPRVIDLLDREGLIESEPPDADDRAGGRPHARAADLPRAARRAPAEPRARRRGLPPGPRLRDPARLWPQPPVRGRDPDGRGRRGAGPAGAGLPRDRSRRSR